MKCCTPAKTTACRKFLRGLASCSATLAARGKQFAAGIIAKAAASMHSCDNPNVHAILMTAQDLQLVGKQSKSRYIHARDWRLTFVSFTIEEVAFTCKVRKAFSCSASIWRDYGLELKDFFRFAKQQKLHKSQDSLQDVQLDIHFKSQSHMTYW